ncbi:DMT family transporter [Rhodobium gokarnense]|uniref:Drug/metabolite transporter (DMT)-like permease n=1 Tax=Rhodobium gokarnense TaxID=364296 RepID=A0ABT3HIJ8_9HYPH|nr:DMT family transporter [Rhodobium gokarnense]MCW2310242.1 drug/metabolite transporter (DMT)-like permease [Rhodobium gokarnense]
MRPVLGVILKIASGLVLTGMVMLVKIVGERIPIGEVVFARTFFSLFPILAMIAIRGELGSALRLHRPKLHVARAAVGLIAMASWFGALTMMPLPDATAISYSAPLYSVAFAALFLGETVRAYRWGAVFVGFVGMLVIMSPHLGLGSVAETPEARTGALLCLVAAVGMAGAMTLVRKMTETEKTASIVLFFALVGSALSLATLPFGWVWPSPYDAFLLVMTGLVGGFGQFLLTQSYRYADASTIAPFDYIQLIWAMMVGWAVFGEVPTLAFYIGGAIVAASGLFVIYREHRLGLDRDRTRQRRAGTPAKY